MFTSHLNFVFLYVQNAEQSERVWELFEQMTLFGLEEAMAGKQPMTPEQKQLQTIMEEREAQTLHNTHLNLEEAEDEDLFLEAKKIPQDALRALRMSADDYQNKLQRVRCVAV